MISADNNGMWFIRGVEKGSGMHSVGVNQH